MSNETTWIPIDDNAVRHIWIDSSGGEHAISQTFYEESGTPVDEKTDNDMTYARTETKLNKEEE